MNREPHFVAQQPTRPQTAASDLALESEHFRLVAEEALVGIYIIQDGRLRYVNAALAEMFGYRPDELIDRVAVLDLIHPDDREGVAARTRRRLAGERATTPHAARGVRRDGELLHFESLSRRVTYRGRPAVIGTLVNVTACMRAQEEIRQQRQELRRLSAQLIAAREAECKRISQELHDVIGQALTAVSINLAQIEQNLPPDVVATVGERLIDSERLITETLTLTRKLSLELRPSMLDELGLLPTLRWYVHQFGERLGIRASFRAGGMRRRLAPELETVLYRVVQEALTNVARHARAGAVDVHLERRAAHIVLTVTDDGAGFDVQALEHVANEDGRLGLVGIRERIALFGGTLHVTSRPGKGTQLQITLPHLQTDNGSMANMEV